MGVFAEFLHGHLADRHFHRAAQQVVQRDAQLAREALVDHFERRHAAAHDAHLARKIVGAGFAGRRGRLGADGTGVDAVQQRVDFILVEYFLAAHGAAYCITKEVKYRASTLLGSPPISLTMARTASRQRLRNVSLPSAVDTEAYV